MVTSHCVVNSSFFLFSRKTTHDRIGSSGLNKAIDVSENKENPIVLINPEIIAKSEETLINEEGCLSVPGCYAKVDRHTQVTVKALDINGEEFTLDGEELLAICIQHELDHLKGILFVDYLSPLKRQRIKTKLEKEARLNNAK